MSGVLTVTTTTTTTTTTATNTATTTAATPTASTTTATTNTATTTAATTTAFYLWSKCGQVCCWHTLCSVVVANAVPHQIVQCTVSRVTHLQRFVIREEDLKAAFKFKMRSPQFFPLGVLILLHHPSHAGFLGLHSAKYFEWKFIPMRVEIPHCSESSSVRVWG